MSERKEAPDTVKDDLQERLHEHWVRLGKKGGQKSAAVLTPSQRKQRARKAAQTRWSKKKKGGEKA